MEKLKDKIIGYLNMGLNPTVISFEDDGLFYLFDKLLKGKTTSNSYDPVFTFVHVTLGYLQEISTSTIEAEINDQLTRDAYEGDTIMETYMNNVETVCVIDDVAYLDDIKSTINAVDNLVKKYRGILHFVYVVEDPMIVSDLSGSVSHTSSFVDALMYQEIGQNWTIESLKQLCIDQFRKELSKEDISEIADASNLHLGTFKRLYKDKCLGISSINRYINLLTDNLDSELLNTLKKVKSGKMLSLEEKKIYESYEKVGFIKENEITIPLIRDIIDKIEIPAIVVEERNGSRNEIDDLDLTEAEKDILKFLFNEDTIVTKSQLGDVIWKDEVNKKYSEWAIDQRINRLRRKLIDISANIDVETVYGKGYKITVIEKR